ncbi:MAG: hypothetical protein ACRC6N_07455 [Plesiomonas sp.]|uniref:hypothetical protein n=1 Tax=Plesiomonas sp. TaxID=2486279 RepID=UPI003F3DD1F5
MTLGQIPITRRSESKAYVKLRRQEKRAKKRQKAESINKELTQMKTAIAKLEKLNLG